MTHSITLMSVVLDCPDAGKLADFYAGITGGDVIFRDDRWAILEAPGARIDFQTAPGHVSPTWPDPTSSMQMHLDFYVDDPDDAEARVLAAGAVKHDHQPGDHFRVYTDPAGHLFCLCAKALPGAD